MNYKFLNKKLLNNIKAYLSVFAFQIIIQVIFPPLMILIWGTNYYGLIIFLISVPTSLSFLIINFITPSRQYMAKVHLKKKISQASKIYTNTIFLLSLSYILYFLSSLIFLNFVDLDKFSNLSEIKNINFILLLIFSSIILGFITSIASLKISYMGVYHISKYLDFSFDLIIKISMIVIGIYSKSILFVFQIYFLITIIKVIIYFYYSKKVSNILYSFKNISFEYIKDIIKKSVPYYLIQLEEIFKTSLVITIIGFYFSFEIVALVSTLRTMFYFFPRKFFELVSEVLQYEYVRLDINKKFSKLKKLYLNQNIFVLILGIIFLAISYFFGSEVYNLWTKSRFQYDSNLIFILTLDCFFFLIVNSNISFFKSINNFSSISGYIFISQIVLILTVFLSFNNGAEYYLYFYVSAILSFIVFTISPLYFINSLKYISIKKNIKSNYTI